MRKWLEEIVTQLAEKVRALVVLEDEPRLVPIPIPTQTRGRQRR